MLITILKKLRQQMIFLLLVALVLLAAYVSIGRQFMPVVSRYSAFFEEQIFGITGLPVSVASLTGAFQGFNPSVRVNGFSLLFSEDPDHSDSGQDDAEASALLFEQASLVIDVPRSIWQRRWVFSEFIVEGLAINAVQNEDGSWRLNDINFSGDGDIDLASVYQSFLQVSQLNLRDVSVQLTTNNQNTIAFANGAAVIQNRNGNHFLHVDASLAGSNEPLRLSLEVRGATLEQINGRAHLAFPMADYSELVKDETVGNVAIQQLVGGAEFWIAFAGGNVSTITVIPQIDTITFLTADSDSISFEDIDGKLSLRRSASAEQLELTVADMSVSWAQLEWAPFNMYLDFKREQSVSFKADSIDLSFLSQVALNSGWLSSAAEETLAAYSPGGLLNNIALFWPLQESTTTLGSLRTNLQGVDLGSVNGSPALWGMKGYVEANYDQQAGVVEGFGEVESDEFRINIPSLFVDTWDYDYVNGRLDFRVDLNAGPQIHLVSSVIVAESSAVDGRIQFASTLQQNTDGSRDSNLDLLVGALRVDADQKSLYLPTAPDVAEGLRNTMQWLDTAIKGGQLKNSGVVYRGSTVRGANPLSKTFQSFYVLDDGELVFSEAWPGLSGVAGLVITDDSNINIEVSAADSLGVAARNVSATVRRNELNENWLSIEGDASAATAVGLDYLQAAPVGDGLHNALSNWQAEGDFEADIKVNVPLSNPQNGTNVHLDIRLAGNSLTMPTYALEFDKVAGTVIYDTRTGLDSAELGAQLFAEPITVQLSSQYEDDALRAINVEATGAAAPQALIEWPLQGSFVRQLLASMEGNFNYQARLQLPQSDSPILTVESTLAGAALNLPQPFAKPMDSELPLKLEFEFASASQRISGELGKEVGFDLRVDQGSFSGGLLAFGEDWMQVESQINTQSNGLAVIGRLGHLNGGEWITYLSAMNSGGNSANPGSGIAFVDVMVDELEMYEQKLPDVGLRIENDAEQNQWSINLRGDAVSGQVLVPFARGDYLQIALEHLHLPGAAQDEADAEPAQPLATDAEPALVEPTVVQRVDVLAQIDPRQLPKMKFSATDISIGERPFGRWQFTLDSDNRGAEFSNLAFNFRGLRVGLDAPVAGETEAVTPHFGWHYDGSNHRSIFSGILRAGNLADVLRANGYAPSLESTSAKFTTNINWAGSPAFFSASSLSGGIGLEIADGRFLQEAGGSNALKLISIINFDALMRRLRFSDDLLRRGLAYDTISGNMRLQDGHVDILDRLVISGPSSLYQITGELDLAEQTINGEMYLTLPVSANIPWLGLLTANLPLAVGAYLFDRIFGDQVSNLTSAVYTLQGPWEGLQPQFKQAFGSPGSPAPAAARPVQ